MAVEVKESGTSEKTYPYLGKSAQGQVVLFFKAGEGTNLNGIGCIIASYGKGFNESAFTPLSPSESITISNKA
jgi:hypothetical protein